MPGTMNHPTITGEQFAEYLDYIADEAAKGNAKRGEGDNDLFITEGDRAFAYNAAGDFVSTRLREGESKIALTIRLCAGMNVGARNG